ncbi:DUF3558 domain-containing protein [Saccharopolyspora phatthalungensis]|uniref:DUF3558 domain-containing protein n=1 Tax=Saccharopolyspora phatthalungensis TaxID=664693 RepID=A0A840PZC0_9PSEU|nr:DUF3558 domain-containing protein [Saccharopolyspora phatthalungensis]MBB5153107.1 hypothetical protein [Saccharopolyspora phatthalungensis]
MTIVRRCVLVLPVLFLSAVTGCAAQVPGEPIPAAGFHDNYPGQPRSSIATHANIATPRNPDGIAPCALLTPADLAVVGGAVGSPHPDNPIAGACAQLLASGPENTAAAGFYDPYEIAVSRQPRGVPVDVEGHSVWLYCELVNTHQTCTAATAIRSDRTLLTMLSMQGASAADTSDQLFQLTTAALHKLPPA